MSLNYNAGVLLSQVLITVIRQMNNGYCLLHRITAKGGSSQNASTTFMPRPKNAVKLSRMKSIPVTHFSFVPVSILFFLSVNS